MSLFVEETYVDDTNGAHLCEEGPYETKYDKAGDLFKAYRQEFGKPKKVYVDSDTLGTIQVGWCFTKRMPYDDEPRKKFLRTVWVTVYEVCAADDARALQWNYGKPDELDDNQSLRQLVLGKE